MSAVRSAALERAAELLGPLAVRDRPLGPLTTYRVGGPADLFVEVADEHGLGLVAAAVAESGVDVLVVGQGSNLLVADAGWRGLAVRVGAGLATLELDAEPAPGEEPAAAAPTGRLVRAGGGLAYPVLARRTAAAGLTGLEWAVGIPGSVGGAVRMNAGGHGADTASVLVSARVVDLSTGADRTVPAGGLDLSYRRSAVRPCDLVAAATFRVSGADPAACEARIGEIVRWRRANQPGGQNAGSVFSNPPDDSAGRLVDAAGLKGLRIGSAEVSSKHANFIQADPGGSADDVIALVAEVRRLVRERTGVELQTELRIVGVQP